MLKAKKHELLTSGRGNPKTQKGEGLGYLTLILHLSPSRANSREIDLCPFASKECIEACLNEAGRGAFDPNVKKARVRKTEQFLDNRQTFLKKILEEIYFYIRRANKKELTLAVRLNGTSDIPWHKIKYKGKNVFEWFPSVQFYDYTKNPDIMKNSLKIENYHVTFSWSGHNENHCQEALGLGINVAVPFQVKKGEDLPKEFLEKPVLDGDLTDLRFLDKAGSIVGLRVKGHKQKKMTSNFLVQIERLAS